MLSYSLTGSSKKLKKVELKKSNLLDDWMDLRDCRKEILPKDEIRRRQMEFDSEKNASHFGNLNIINGCYSSMTYNL